MDPSTYRIRIKGKYPQFAYWLAMPFFAPMPWEAEAFYAQPGMKARNITLDWYPVGTGPFMLTENNPNLRMVLARNPNFRGETYPSRGRCRATREAGSAGRCRPAPALRRPRRLQPGEGEHPLLEQVPAGLLRQLRGLLGRLRPGRAARRPGRGQTDRRRCEAKGIRLLTSVRDVHHLPGLQHAGPGGGRGLGARPPAAPGHRHRHRLRGVHLHLRQRPRGHAQGPLAAGDLRRPRGGGRDQPLCLSNGRTGARCAAAWRRRGPCWPRPVSPGGRDQATGQTLTIYFDAAASGPDDKSRLDWFRKQFEKLGIELVIRSTDYNRFQEKMRNGHGADLHVGLERRLPGPGELSLPALRPQRQGGAPRGRTPPTTPIRSSTALFEQMQQHGQRPRAPGRDRPDAGDRPPRCPLGLGLLPQGLHPAPSLAATTPCPTSWPTTP